MKSHYKIIGRIEKISFTEFNINDVDAKIDTGAYRNALHCSEIKLADGKLHVTILDHPNHPENITMVFNDFKTVKIRSSNGFLQRRYLIKTKVKFGKKIYHTSFSLVNREKMKYSVLLGREFLKNHFLINVNFKYLIDENWRIIKEW
ncbi:MAG TPA: peptidase [Flavobacteriales bacterium]|nr:peptidase [Flavobacteriales bacterium]